MMSQLHLSLLGTPVVKHGEHTLTFSTRKALALLVYLAVEGGLHPRKTLSEAFWPELDTQHGRAALRATLLELRRLLEASHGPGEPAHLLIKRDMLGVEQAARSSWTSGSSKRPASRWGAGLNRWPARGVKRCWRSSSRRRAWPAARFWQASRCATRSFSTIGRARSESPGTCGSTSSLMLCRCSTNGRGMRSVPSRRWPAGCASIP